MGMVILFDDPVTLYRGNETRVVHKQSEYEAAMKEGFGPYRYREFPKALYHETLPDVRVENDREESVYLEQGYTDRPSKARREVDKPMTPEPSFAPKAESGDNDLKLRIAKLEGMIEALLQQQGQASDENKPKSKRSA